MWMPRKRGWDELGKKDEEEEGEVQDLVEGGELEEAAGGELGMLHELLVKGVGVIMQDHTCGTTDNGVSATKILHGVRAEVEQQEVEVPQQRLNPTMMQKENQLNQLMTQQLQKQRRQKKNSMLKLMKTVWRRMKSLKKKVTMKMYLRNWMRWKEQCLEMINTGAGEEDRKERQ